MTVNKRILLLLLGLWHAETFATSIATAHTAAPTHPSTTTTPTTSIKSPSSKTSSPTLLQSKATAKQTALQHLLNLDTSSPPPSSLLQVTAKAAITGIPMLSPEKCATLANAPPSEPILEKERCSLCDTIVDNARKWNWVGHYSAMCENVPPHALEWCEYYACKIAECSYFRSNTCKVINSVDQKSVVTMNPCPAKYLCSYCLQIPHTQVFGCFDGSIGSRL